MTPTLGYLLALLVIVFVIDFTLRALPFKILEPLRDSRFVSDMAVWMPPGIMLILVLSTLSQGMQVAGGRWWAALVATGITVRSQAPVERRCRHARLHRAAELALTRAGG